MTWEGESRRHSLARKGIGTADGKAFPKKKQPTEKEMEARRKESEKLIDIQRKQHYDNLKKYNPDWFVKELDEVKWNERKYTPPNWLALTNKNRSTRLPEAIGKIVGINMGWSSSEGGLITVVDAELLSIEGDKVKVDVYGKEIELQDYRVKWIPKGDK